MNREARRALNRANKIKGAQRKSVELVHMRDEDDEPITVVIRKLAATQLIEFTGMPIGDFDVQTGQEAFRRQVATLQDDGKIFKVVNQVLEAGLVDPSIGDGGDQISLADLGADDMTLFEAIMEHSGFTEVARENVRAFREEPGE